MYTVATMRSDLNARVSLTGDPTQIQGWQDSAIKECIDSCWWRIVDVTFTDIPVGGGQRRWVLGGANITVLPPVYQVAPDGAAGKVYLPFSSVSWRQNAPDDVIIEQGVTLTGDPSTTPTPTGIIVATAAPTPDQTAPANTWVRIWYQRRVAQPDYTVPASLIRAPEQFARIATLGYYLGVLSDNQAGGDIRQWRKMSEDYRQQAAVLFDQETPPVNPTKSKADDWLSTGVPG